MLSMLLMMIWINKNNNSNKIIEHMKRMSHNKQSCNSVLIKESDIRKE